MTLGEKLTALECVICDFASSKLNEAHLDPALAEIVMGGAYRRFQENAYHDALLHMAVASAPHSPRVEEHEGTIEDLIEHISGDSHVHSS